MYCRLNVRFKPLISTLFFPPSRFRGQLQRRLQSLSPARLRPASQNEPGSRRVPAGERVHPAVRVHVRHRHSNLPELLRSKLQDFPANPAENPEPEIQFQLQTGEPVPQQRCPGSEPSAARPAGCERCHVETLVD